MNLNRKWILILAFSLVLGLIGYGLVDEWRWRKMKDTISAVKTGMTPSEVHEILKGYYLTKEWKWSELDCEQYRHVNEPTEVDWSGESSMLVCYKDRLVEKAGVSVK